MFFVMVDHVENNKIYPRRVGKMHTSFASAVKTCKQRKGYIQDEFRKIIGQAFDSTLPKFIG